ncbi:MAG: CDP-glycerol glycerophosphotransferase family protein [Alphaproteobacteria bacterium]|nr:CDP-glycerol glycerophosphotransferase family protein [Alphaproteobacteria bacterium]
MLKFIKKFRRNKLFKLQDSTLERVRERAKKRHIRVAFLSSENAKWQYQSLYEDMLKNDRFDPFVLITVRKSLTKTKYSFLNYKKITQDNFDSFKLQNMKVYYAHDIARNEPIDIAEFAPDIVFYEQPWDIFEIHDIEHVSKFAVPMFVSYGSSIDNGTYESTHPFFQEVYRYFMDNDVAKTRLIDGGADKARIITTGSLSLDAYRKQVDISKINWTSKGKPRIIWCPHHSFYEGSALNFGTFDWNYRFMLEYAKTHNDIEFILKPHPELKRQIVRHNLMNIKEVEDYFNLWSSLKNAKVIESGNYIDMFRTSDLLITDCNSFVLEYFPTKKPVIQLINKNSVGHNEFGQMITNTYYKAYTVEDIESLFNTLIYQKQDNKKFDRLKVLESLKLDYNTSGKIINHILNLVIQ